MPRQSPMHEQRRFPVGAEVMPQGGVHFRVWAPKRRAVDVVLANGSAVPLAREPDGYFSGLVKDVRAGSRYRFRLDGGEDFPDPVSRFQPEGPHGPSEVVDPRPFAWTDQDWRGPEKTGQVVYELHVGTFTPEGTYTAAAERLGYLKDLGVTLVEVMPVADFAGTFGWGYDGVDLYAPTRLYGRPDDLRRFVDRAHALGLAVILDVVYNHIGPDGNYLGQYTDTFFSTRHHTDWGDAINYDGEGAQGVREYAIGNAGYWIEEFHFDGLRLDATQNIYDDGSLGEHLLAELGREVRRRANGRSTLIVAENEPQETILLRPPEQGGYGLDMAWNDDLHHTARVALLGRREAYLRDYCGTPQELVSAMKWGYLYQGQRYDWQDKPRGTPTYDLEPASFVSFLENHDQISNAMRGLHLHALTSPGKLRAMTALLLLGPGTPLLFQGQEFHAAAPFVFFADHNDELRPKVRQGRGEFLAQFESIANPEGQRVLDDPGERETFRRCVLDWGDAERNAPVLQMHKDLLALRRGDPVIAAQRKGAVDGAVLGAHAFVLRYFGGSDGDRLLLVNLGSDLALRYAPEPLLAAPPGTRWETVWSSEDPRYGGCCTPLVEDERRGFWLTAESAVVLRPAAREVAP